MEAEERLPSPAFIDLQGQSYTEDEVSVHETFMREAIAMVRLHNAPQHHVN
jgi:hypothetical protein